MLKWPRFLWEHRRALAVLAALAAAAFAAFYHAVTLEEGVKRHRRKQLSELARMPGRLRT